MAKLTIEVPDDLRDALGVRAQAEGYSSVEAYVAGLLREDFAEQDFGAPAHLHVGSTADLVAMVGEGLATPATEMTDADWADMRERLLKRHGGR